MNFIRYSGPTTCLRSEIMHLKAHMLVRSWSQEIAIPIPDFFITAKDEKIAESITSHSQSLSLPAHQTRGSFQEISPEKFHEWLVNPISSGFKTIYVVDARFDYEFFGGHISSAINITSRHKLSNFFTAHESEGKDSCIVFHCEFSKNRGPKLMSLFREIDRKMNFAQYPHLSFPNVYLLEGGYKLFYSRFPDLCTGGYCPMRDEHHVLNGDLRRCHSEYNRNMRSGSTIRRRCTSMDLTGLSMPFKSTSATCNV